MPKLQCEASGSVRRIQSPRREPDSGGTRTLETCRLSRSQFPTCSPKSSESTTWNISFVGGNNEPDGCDALKSSFRSLRNFASARDSAVSGNAEMLRDNINHCTASHSLLPFSSLILQGDTRCRRRYAPERCESSGQVQSLGDRGHRPTRPNYGTRQHHPPTSP